MTDWLREAIEGELVIEREGWAAERAARVTAQLQRDRADRFETLVVWSDEHTAFTGPGRTVYFGRRLLERLPDDDAAAFVIAHEIAHHRLGHVPALPKVTIQLPIKLVVAALATWIAGMQHERDADLLAIEMCIAAGYDVERCLHALEHLTNVALDYGDVDGVLGPEDPAFDGRRSHPPTLERIAAARAHAARYREGHRIERELADRRASRKRKLAIAAGAAAAGVVLLLIRRR